MDPLTIPPDGCLIRPRRTPNHWWPMTPAAVAWLCQHLGQDSSTLPAQR